MNKRALLILSVGIVFALFLTSFALGANETASSDVSTKAYNCLKEEIKDKEALSFEEAVFSALALGNYEKIFEQLKNHKHATESCWPKAGCKIKESSLALLAYKRLGQSTDSIKNWLLSNNKSASELRWLLEIDISGKIKSSCTLNDGSRDNKIDVLEDMTISGSLGSCFEKDMNGYMLRIKTNCLKKEFKISCDQDFKTSIIYQQDIGSTLFVMPETHSGSAGGFTTEKVEGECFKTGTSCDYEGTLWATLALQEIGADVTNFIPYLFSLEENNARYFPSVFLYILAGGNEHYNSIMQSQDSRKYWQISGGKGRFYDTSLAMMALNSQRATTELEEVKSYFASNQGNSGCWDGTSIKSTAFLLYAGWPRVTGSGGNIIPSCESPNSCVSIYDCPAISKLENYDCSGPGVVGKVCCSAEVEEKTCAEQDGILCDSGYECKGTMIPSSDDRICCNEACIESEEPEETCSESDGTCRAECKNNEEIISGTCEISDDVCCYKSKEGGSLLWIFILIILIILVVLAIIFREKLKMFWFRLRSKKSSPPSSGGRVAAQTGMRPNFMPFLRPALRPMSPQQRMPIRTARPVAKDKEMEDALKKLRDISKK